MAAKLYHKAAEQGIAEAQYNLGVMYRNGRGVGQSDATAMKWYRKAAEQGQTAAQYNLGAMYANGSGVARNLSEALRWARKAEVAGQPEAAGLIQVILELQRQQQQQAAEGATEFIPSSPSIPIGTNVQLRGLQAKPELNGQRGVVTAFVASTGRCSVQLENGRGPYNIKPENLTMEE